MSEHNQPSAIKFSLEETVSFRKGEELEQLFSLWIEPDVTIHDLDQFVSIHGSLKMYGEYKKNEDEHREEEAYSFSGQKYVTVFETRNDGVSEFRYDFPVDITIPKTRVENIEDLNVVIDMFDYDIQDNASLKITTDVSITGVESEEATVYNREDFVSNEEQEIQDSADYQNQLLGYEEVPILDFDGEDENTFVVEAKKEERKDEDKDTHIPLQVEPPSLDVEGFEEDVSAQANRHRHEEDHATESDVQEESHPHLVEYIDTRSSHKTEDEDNKVTYINPRATADSQERAGREHEEETTSHNKPIELVSHGSGDDDEDFRDESDEDSEDKNIKLHSHQEQDEKESISLTQFFARKDENAVVRMKIYIVQEDDTLDDIAERYDVSVSQILRTNNLEPHQDAYEGQVLYIPEKQKSH